jgi:hypothetical protein
MLNLLFKLMIVLIAVTAIAGILTASFVLYPKEEAKEPEQQGQEPDQGQGQDQDGPLRVYTNENLGFSIKIPEKIMHPNGFCKWVEDEQSYRPEPAPVPVRVFEDGNNVYISTEYFYQLAGQTVENDRAKFSECNKITNSLEALNNEDYWQQQDWKITVAAISNDEELESFIKNKYGTGCMLGEKMPSDQEGVYDVSVNTGSENMQQAVENDCLINYISVLKYYPAANKVVQWDLGQAPRFYKIEGYPYAAFDQEMKDSFRFIEPEEGPDKVYEVPVLNLRYMPVVDGKVDISKTGDWHQTSVEALRYNIDNLTRQLATALDNGSAYHGYKDEASEPVLNYTILENKEFLYPVPMLYETNSPADHKKILTDLNICDYVDNKGVKEVWIWMYHTGAIYPVESYMTGPLASFGNGYMDLPKCGKTYTVYDYNYGRSVAMALENHTHQLERVFGYVDNSLFWDKFVGNQSNSRCGWTHYPPNGESDYDWMNEKEVLSDCEDWNPDGTGEKKIVSCHTWSQGESCANDEGYSFKVWWMQNMPKSWWDFIGDFDRAKQLGEKLWS